MTSTRSDRATDLGLLALTIIWGVNFSVVKALLTLVPPTALNALRFPLAAAVLWAAVRRTPGPRFPQGRDVAPLLLLGLLGHVAYQGCFIFGLARTTAGNASLLLATTPVWTVLLSAAARHETPVANVYAGIGLTVAGMVLVVVGGGERLALRADTLDGDLLMIGAALLWSVYTVAGRPLVVRYGSLRLTAWTLWVGTPFLVAWGLPSLSADALLALGLPGWAGVAYAGVLSLALAYLLWYRGVRRLGNARTAAFSNLVPVAALLTAWIALGEVPTWVQGLGALVILTGLTVSRLAAPAVP